MMQNPIGGWVGDAYVEAEGQDPGADGGAAGGGAEAPRWGVLLISGEFTWLPQTRTRHPPTTRYKCCIKE